MANNAVLSELQGGCKRTLRMAVAMLLGASGCVFDPTFPPGTELRCSESADCIDGRGCLLTAGVCVSDGPCVVRSDRGLQPVADGNRCALDATSDDEGVCVSGRCGTSRCGDAILDARRGELCDDGDGVNDDTLPGRCRTDCAPPRCGDAVVDPGEECDDGNSLNEDGCFNDCRANRCGDGVVHVGVEQCDDGNVSAQDACLPGCVANVCGDAVHNVGNEECDDGNVVSGDGCSAACDFVAWQADVAAALPPSTSPIAWDYAIIEGEGERTVHALGVVTAEGVLVALDRGSGAELWRYVTGGAVSAPPVASAHGVYLVNDDGTVHGMALAGPSALPPPWQFALSLPSAGAGLAAPAGAHRDAVIAIDEAGELYQLDSNDGARLPFGVLGLNNSYDLSTRARDYEPTARCDACTATVVHGLDTLNNDNDNGVFGLVVPLGDEVWAWTFMAADCPPARFSVGPALGQIAYRGYCGFSTGGLDDCPFYATLQTGELVRVTADGSAGCAPAIAELLTTGPARFVSPPVVADDTFSGTDAAYVVDDEGGLFRFFLLRSIPPVLALTPGWPVALGAPASGAPALAASGELYVGDTAGQLHALVALSGATLWTVEVGPLVGSPLVLDDLVFVASASGVVSAIERGGDAAPPTWWARRGGNVGGTGNPAVCGEGATAPPAFVMLLLLWRSARSRARGSRRAFG